MAARASYLGALESYRELARVQPEIYRPHVAMTLNNLGNVQRALNDLETARGGLEEALEIVRDLAQVRPDVHLRDVAVTLNNLGLLELQRGEDTAARDHLSDSVRTLLRVYRRLPAAYRASLRKCALDWLAALLRSGGSSAAWEAWQSVADEFPAEDLLARTLEIAFGLSAHRWDAVEAALGRPSGPAGEPAAEDRGLIAATFLDRVREPAAPVEALAGLLGRMPESLRHACEDAAVGLVPTLLRERPTDAAGWRQVADRMRAVFGAEDAVGAGLRLLEAGLKYLEAGRQESAILNLPVEQRRLIIETCGAESESGPEAGAWGSGDRAR
jgi:tetratricopeptide (TPR) repeat protein